jgi:SAM-dependent methyltransferase
VSTADAQAFWDALHARRDPERPGRPHPYLVEAMGAASPGAALELGSGDGANAIWLAAAGWDVLAVDLSPTALALAAAHAGRAGVSERIAWRQADLAEWSPADDADLVCSFFLHTNHPLDRTDALARAAARVRPGGTLLVVGHATLPPWAWDPDDTADLPRGAVLAAALGLDGPGWDVRRAEEVPRVAVRGDQRAEVLDSVVHAVRLA